MSSELVQVLMAILLVLVNTFVPIIGLALRKWLIRKSWIEELLLKEEWVESAVYFAEQTYGHLKGPQQYEKAVEWLSKRAIEKGVKITPDEIKGLIEAAVLKMKEGWFYEEDF